MYKTCLILLSAALLVAGCADDSSIENKSELRILLSYDNEQYYTREISAVDAVTFSYTDSTMTSQITGTLKAGGKWVPVEIPNGTNGEFEIAAFIAGTEFFRGYRNYIEFPTNIDRSIEVTLFDSLPPIVPLVDETVADEAPFTVEGHKEHGTAIFADSRLVVEMDESITFSFDLPLAPGENEVALKAVDRAGNYSSYKIFSFFYGGQTAGCSDSDGDGYTSSLCGGLDCNDIDEDIAPHRAEIAYDGIDNDCNGIASNDRDGDGFDLLSLGGDDCNDNDRKIYPGAVEFCGDGIDQNCDGVDPPCNDADADGDGYSLLDGDCDDVDPNVNPAATEIIYNGIDDDCNLKTVDDDLDRDGFRVEDDCQDNDASINPGAYEIFGDELDQNCDGESE